MAEKFGVGVKVMRQALRILEARGACRLQRGRGGGVMVLRPGLDRAASALAESLAWSGASLAEISEARAVIQPMAGEVADQAALSELEQLNPGLALAVACLLRFSERSQGDLGDALNQRVRGSSKPLVHSADGVGRGLEARGDKRRVDASDAHDIPHPLLNRSAHRNLAEVVANRISRDITHDRLKAHERLGSLWDLASQHGVSLAVITDAIRILEDAGLVTCVTGRAGGITLKLPEGDAVVAVVHGYLSAAGMSEAQCNTICHALNVRAACKAAELRNPTFLAAMQDVYRRMGRAQGEAVMQHWYELQKLLHEEAGNRPLHLLTRCLAAYCVRIAAIDAMPSPPEGFVGRIVLTTGQLVDAVRAGDVSGAADAQSATRRVLDERSPAR